MVARTPAGHSPARLLRRLAGWLAGIVAALVVGLHGYLLWQRVADLTLFQPVVGLRWLIGLLLVAAVLRLRRAGLSLVRGRKALVFWLLMVILHSGMPGAAAAPGKAPAELPVLALTLAAVWVALTLAARGGIGRAPVRRAGYSPLRQVPRTPADGSFALLSRPPPPLFVS